MIDARGKGLCPSAVNEALGESTHTYLSSGFRGKEWPVDIPATVHRVRAVGRHYQRVFHLKKQGCTRCEGEPW